MSKIRLLCGLFLYCVIILLLLSSFKHSFLGLIATGPFFSDLHSQGPTSSSVDCCHLFCLFPFAWEDNCHLFLVCYGVSLSPEHSCGSPITFSIKSNIFVMVLWTLPQLKSFFCQLLSSLICFGSCFWLRRISQFAFEPSTSQT